jgi:hypothetical protein
MTSKSSRSPGRARSAVTGRFVTKGEARAAARTKVTVDKKLGRKTPSRITDLANG